MVCCSMAANSMERDRRRHIFAGFQRPRLGPLIQIALLLGFMTPFLFQTTKVHMSWVRGFAQRKTNDVLSL